MKKIDLYPINDEQFSKIATILNHDDNLFVNFYNVKSTIGIFMDNQIIGLFNLNKFINNTLAIHIALLKEFRNHGIGGIVFEKILEEYGQIYSDVEFFIANTDYKNERAIHFFYKLGWHQTYRYDEQMDNEGGEFFIIFEKENPYYHRKVMTYDTK